MISAHMDADAQFITNLHIERNIQMKATGYDDFTMEIEKMESVLFGGLVHKLEKKI